MPESKNILIIGDMPGYGKMGLAGMLPILSSMGHSIYNLPTALVSNNFDYGKFSVLDTTQYMEETIQVWRTMGFRFDCITTGFWPQRLRPACSGILLIASAGRTCWW